jgi:long-chain fatty acid transport protein
VKWTFRGAVRHCVAAILTCLPLLSYASDFNLPFVNASQLGNLYSGWAAEAVDASTAYTNPAGLVKIQNKQLVLAGDGLFGSTRFQGTGTPSVSGSASSKLRAFLPSFYFSYPVSERLVLAFSETVPFGLGTNYPKDGVTRYSATRTQVAVIDVGPSFGLKLNDHLSVGAGLDIEHISFTINSMYGSPLSVPDSEGQNHENGWGWGAHAGVLLQPLPTTRIGLNYVSQVVMRTHGDSMVFLPTGNVYSTSSQRSSASLPALVQLSLYHELTPQLALMGTVFYTNWSAFSYIVMQKTMLPSGSTTAVTMPFEYHNTFDYSIGLNYKATEKWTLKTGFEILNTPINRRDRSPADPIGSAKIAAIGVHYQQNVALGYDLAYCHSFFNQTAINQTTPLITLAGNSRQNTNVVGLQVTWDMV